MANIIRTVQANQDTAEIWLSIALDNLTAADKFVDAVDQTLDKLVAMPHMGRSRDDLAPDLRGFSLGNYLIFYRPIEDGIVVIRVLHGARDLPHIFKQEKSS